MRIHAKCPRCRKMIPVFVQHREFDNMTAEEIDDALAKRIEGHECDRLELPR